MRASEKSIRCASGVRPEGTTIDEEATPRFGRASTYALARIPASGTEKTSTIVSAQLEMLGSRVWNSASSAVIIGLLPGFCCPSARKREREP